MIKGILYLISASFCFALSTVFLKTGMNAPYFVSPATATFARFFLGFIVFAGYMVYKKEPARPNNLKLVAARGILNTVAVIFFFAGIKYTTITKANILNLTYPAFVFLVSPLITGERSKAIDYVFLLATLAGSWLIVMGGPSAGFSNVNKGDLFALLSGVIAGFGISCLREARKNDSTQMILAYQMSIGSLVCFFLMLPGFKMPGSAGLWFLFLTSVMTVAGQFLITEGYMYISAALGSVVSGTGIFFAAMLGITFFNDPLTLNIIIGGLLIFLAMSGVSGVLAKTKRYIPFIDFD